MLNRVPAGIAWPLITSTSDPSASVDACRIWSKPADEPGVERHRVPTVTSAGMPCRARAWRSALGSSRVPLRSVSVVLLPGPLVTENAVSSAARGLADGGLPVRACGLP